MSIHSTKVRIGRTHAIQECIIGNESYCDDDDDDDNKDHKRL